ncbi:helix-turn-helix domain-containing protein [Alkaliphilus crotonatoxidans]
MKNSMEESQFYGNNVKVIKKEENCVVYKMRDATGEGQMTRYSVFPGIDVLYNDFHMQSCLSAFRPNADMIAIDHCHEGRIEWELKNGTYLYLQEGDLQIDSKEGHHNKFNFPLCHYHGITVAIYIEEAKKTLNSVFNGFDVDLGKLRIKFCILNHPFIMRAQDSIRHIFSELYTVPDRIKKDYLKIKVLELLLFLSVVEMPDKGEEPSYFPKKQVETVKAMMKYMTDHIERHHTLEELSRQFGIPLTAMKRCFKGIYGTSIYAFMRNHRIQMAARMLRETNDNITTIAGRVGYNNPSKFAAAFKDIMGMPPGKYKRQFF